MITYTQADVDRFWRKVVKIPFHECWEWAASLTGEPYGPAGLTGSYGQFYLNGTRIVAHRFIYQVTHGPVPDDMFICHKCDNRTCVRPEHLFLGTHYDNMLDRVRKGRRANARTRLTRAQAEEMRAAYGAGTPKLELADRYGITKQHVGQILSGRRWASRFSLPLVIDSAHA